MTFVKVLQSTTQSYCPKKIDFSKSFQKVFKLSLRIYSFAYLTYIQRWMEKSYIFKSTSRLCMKLGGLIFLFTLGP